jgi:hypothetical protein
MLINGSKKKEITRRDIRTVERMEHNESTVASCTSFSPFGILRPKDFQLFRYLEKRVTRTGLPPPPDCRHLTKTSSKLKHKPWRKGKTNTLNYSSS